MSEHESILIVETLRKRADDYSRAISGGGYYDYMNCDERWDRQAADEVERQAAKIESDAKRIRELEDGYEIQMRRCDAAQAKNESDAKVIAALRERMTQIRAFVSIMGENNWYDVASRIALQAAVDEQTAGEK